MGRLIDADKLKAQVEAHEIKYKFTPTDYQYGHNVGVDKAVADIDDAETVEAIPVEWLEQEMEKWRKKDTFAHKLGIELVEALLKDWEEDRKEWTN